MSRSLIPDKSIAGFVLAGGKSSRMGSDKALSLFAGKPLIANAIELLNLAGFPTRIAGARNDLSLFGQTIPDLHPNAGPMGGIHAALCESGAEWNLFLPVDMPLIPPSLLAYLFERVAVTGCPVTAVRLNGRLEPFPVLLHRSVTSAIAERIETNQAACHAAWQTIPVELNSALDAPDVEALQQTGHCHNVLGLPPSLWFQSANTPQELTLLNSLITGRSAHSRVI